MSKLYHEDFLKMFRDSPNYVHFDDQWRWEIPLPHNHPLIVEDLGGAPSGIPMKDIWKAIEEVFPEDFVTEGVVRKSEEAPTSISTDPHVWMTEKEIHEEKFWGSRQHCSYCDYTPCRCKNEDYGK